MADRARTQLARLVEDFEVELRQEPDESSVSIVNAVQDLANLTIGADVLQDGQLNSSCVSAIACLLVAGYNYNALRRNYREVDNFFKQKEEYALLIGQLGRVVREVEDRNVTIAAHAKTICEKSKALVDLHHKTPSKERNDGLAKLIAELTDVVGDFNAEVEISRFMLGQAEFKITEFLRDLKEAEARNNVQSVIQGALPQVAPLTSLARTHPVVFTIAAIGSLGTLFYNLIRQQNQSEEIDTMKRRLQAIKSEIEQLLENIKKNQIVAKVKIELIRENGIINASFPSITE